MTEDMLINDIYVEKEYWFLNLFVIDLYAEEEYDPPQCVPCPPIHKALISWKKIHKDESESNRMQKMEKK